MKRFSVIALALVCGAALAQREPPARPAAGRIALVDRVVAVVNSEVITQHELLERIERVLRELRRGGTPPPREQLERQVLERLIIDKAQLQLAKETGLRVDDLDLDRTVARVAEDNRMSLTEFRQTLERDGVPFNRFREELRNEIVLSRLREREVDNRIVVSDSELDNYLADQGDKAGAAVEFNLAHVLVRIPEQARPEQVEQRRARAEEAVKRLGQGEDFSRIAAMYSDAPDALQGGSLGWRESNRLPELFVQALSRLQPGAVSGVLRSPAGFHVLKLVERRSAGAAPMLVEQMHARHILLRTSEIVSEDDARRKLLQLRERIVGGADFAELARLHSEDSSASRGGDLGWLYPGDTVPEFERAAAALKPMEVGQPVKSPFGFHLIQVLERRTADVSSERRRLEARKALRDRKRDEAYEEWLRQLRDRTYVDYRLDER